MTNQQAPPFQYPYPNPNQPQINSPQQPNDNGQNTPNFPYPYPYPPFPYPPPYSQPQQPQNGDGQNAPNVPYPYPYPPYPYPPPFTQPQQPQTDDGQKTNNFPYPYPYPPYPYPPHFAQPQPQQQQQNNDQVNHYPPFPYPPYPYSHYNDPQQNAPPPPQQKQQQPQQQQVQHQQERVMFDWEKSRLPGQGDEQKKIVKTPVFDWEKGGGAQPQKPIVIDWDYKSEYDVPEVPPDVQRDTSVYAICTNKAFDPSTLPQLDESFFKLFPSDALADIKAQKIRSTFQKRGNVKVKETFRIKFQFDFDEISDLNVSATFHINELTYKLYEFLNQVVFNEGTRFTIRNTFPVKVIAAAHNQKLKDVKITGNSILVVRISHFTGLKDDVNQQYTSQKKAIAERIQKIESEKNQS